MTPHEKFDSITEPALRIILDKHYALSGGGIVQYKREMLPATAEYTRILQAAWADLQQAEQQ